MMKPKKYYVLYGKNDEIITFGTCKEIAENTGKSMESIRQIIHGRSNIYTAYQCGYDTDQIF